MDIDRRTPVNTAIVLIDYVTGFANLFRSQTVAENVSGAVALAKTAVGYGVPLVVSVGPDHDPRGPLYPEVAAVIADHPVIHRGGSFDAFDHPAFEEAVAATGMRHLVVAGLMTEGCILHTTLGALRRDYSVSLVVDATAGENTVIHDAAVTRMTQLGVVPVSWLSFASELQRTYDDADTVATYLDIQMQAPGFAKNLNTLAYLAKERATDALNRLSPLELTGNSGRPSETPILTRTFAGSRVPEPGRAPARLPTGRGEESLRRTG
jgi:nicotinamidase-related amidase